MINRYYIRLHEEQFVGDDGYTNFSRQTGFERYYNFEQVLCSIQLELMRITKSKYIYRRQEYTLINTPSRTYEMPV